MAKPNDPDGPIHKWGEPEGVADYMNKTPGQKKKKVKEACWDGYKKVGMKKKGKKMVPDCVPEAKTIKVGEDAIGADATHYILVKKRKVVAKGTKEEMLNQCREEGGRVWVSTKDVGDIVEMKNFKEAKYSVDVKDLPRFYMDADSPAEIKKMLRQLLRKASSIDSVERVNDARIKQDLRQRIKGADTDKRHVDEAAEGCFVAGSKIIAYQGDVEVLKNIEDIVVGDVVRGVSGKNTVTTVHDISLEERNFATYKFSGSLCDASGQIKCTDYHPILLSPLLHVKTDTTVWAAENQTLAQQKHPELEISGVIIGDFAKIYLPEYLIDELGFLDRAQAEEQLNQTIMIKNIVKTTETIPVYNFETDGDHTYCVNGVFVHNKTYEALNPRKNDVGDYIDDFKKSDAPQFKGKSMKKRREMAVAAYLAKRGELARDEAYRPPTPAEIAADKKKDKQPRGDRYKSIKNKMYGNAMGGLKKEGRDPFKAAQRSAKHAELSHELRHEKDPYRPGTTGKAARKRSYDSFQHVRQMAKGMHKESTVEYGKSMDRIQAKKTASQLSPEHKKKLAALHNLMKKQRKTGNYKMEEVEQVNELSKKTLGSYAHKAARDVQRQSAIGGNYASAANNTDSKTAKTYNRNAQKAFAKADRRRKGIQRAVSRLAKEEVDQVNELKKSTYGSYIKKASKNAASHKAASVVYGKAADKEAPHSQGQKTMRKHELSSFEKSQRRQKGIERATDRLTKEERAWHKRDDEQKAKGKDHQTLNYTTRGGQKMKTAVHKDKAFAAVGHFRRQGHTDVHLDEARYYRGQRKGSEASLKMLKAASAIEAYAKKKGGVDREDFEMAAMILNSGDFKSFEKFLKQMDTDPREGILQILKKHGMYRGGKIVKEEKDMSPEEKAKKRQAFLDRLRGKPPVKEAAYDHASQARKHDDLARKTDGKTKNNHVSFAHRDAAKAHKQAHSMMSRGDKPSALAKKKSDAAKFHTQRATGLMKNNVREEEELDLNIDEGSIKGSDKSSLKGRLKKAFRKGEADQKTFNTPGGNPRRTEPKNPKTGEQKAYKKGRQAGYSTNKTGAERSKPQDSLNRKSDKMFPKRPTGFGPKPKLPEGVEQQEGFADSAPKKKFSDRMSTAPAPGRKVSPAQSRMKKTNAAPGRHTYAREEMETESFKNYTVTHKPTGKKYKVTAMHQNDAKKKASQQHGGATASRYSGTNHDDFHTEGMVRAVATARRMAGNMTGASKKIDKMKPASKSGKTGRFSDNPRIAKKLQKYNEDVQSWKQFQEGSCGGGSYGGKKMKKEGELSPAQKKHMDTDKDGDIDGKDLATLRNKKKS